MIGVGSRVGAEEHNQRVLKIERSALRMERRVLYLTTIALMLAIVQVIWYPDNRILYVLFLLSGSFGLGQGLGLCVMEWSLNRITSFE